MRKWMWYVLLPLSSLFHLRFPPLHLFVSSCVHSGKCYEITPTGYSPTGGNGCGGHCSPITIMVTNLCPSNGNAQWCSFPVNQYGYPSLQPVAPLLPSTSLFPLPPPYLLHYRSGLLSDQQRRLSTLFSLPSFLSSLPCVASHAAWNSDLPANLARLFALPSFLLLLPSPSSSSSFLLLLLFS